MRLSFSFYTKAMMLLRFFKLHLHTVHKETILFTNFVIAGRCYSLDPHRGKMWVR